MQTQRICEPPNTAQMHYYVRNGSRFDSPSHIIHSYLPGKTFRKSYTYTNVYNYLSIEDIVYKIYRQLHLSPKALMQVMYQDMRLT